MTSPLLTGPVFVNLPVADLARSRAFFAALGMRFDERMCGDEALCLVLREGSAYAMLLRRDFFALFTPRPVAEAATATSVILCVGVEGREDVDRTLDLVTANGGTELPAYVPQGTPADLMYHRTFADPDGHVWEAMWADPAAFAEPEPVGAASAAAGA